MNSSIAALSSDRAQIFSDLLAIDIWHDPLNGKGTAASVYVDVTFSQGRIGGADDEFPFTFRARLKRAYLKLTIERPLSINRASVYRMSRKMDITLNAVREAREELTANAKAGTKISASAIQLSAEAKIAAASAENTTEKLTLNASLPRHLVTPIPASSNSYGWQISPTYEDCLEGQPWDPKEQSLLSVKLMSTSAIDPAIRGEIYCRYEDIDIFDLEPKQKLSIQNLTPNKDAVIRAYIKNLLIRNGLRVGDISNRFSEVLLASIFASEGMSE